MTSDDGLRLVPFRGLRYAPDRVSSLTAVTSPPYDVVVRPEGVHHLETADPYNIVRLILPQAEDPATRHDRAARTLRAWRAEGVLVQDAAPALYVYEQRDARGLQRGLIGALRLDGPVLPHEDVIPEVVADRAALMRAAGAQLEPLLLSYDGSDARGSSGPDTASPSAARAGAARVVERAVHRPPLLHTVTEDGVAHRLWAVTDPAEQAEATTDLATRRALIADGHHRWATYRQLWRERVLAGGEGAESPWAHGLVLLVDTARHPLRVQAIHRVLPHLPYPEAVTKAAPYFRVRQVAGPLPQALEALSGAQGTAFLLAGEQDGAAEFHLLDRPDPTLLDRTVPGDKPRAWRELDATVLHSALLEEVWRVPDDAVSISYLHEASAALTQARHRRGTAVLLRPTSERTVRELAEQGVTMPRKSTSFGPKPATGLVLRLVEEG
ncbi:DUF1015 family protein [Streptomyces sp. NPDC059740]|uniref:DUF1015 family protein n=1 Tax=Streptomyces sp. NPDC059740 TaxID=3346926 RepID=UPI0036665B38